MFADRVHPVDASLPRYIRPRLNPEHWRRNPNAQTYLF